MVVPIQEQDALDQDSAAWGASVDLSSEPVPEPRPTVTAADTLAAAPPAPSPDPIDEAPSAVWYVRPPTGGQFGPASGEIMRTWITAGRIGASSLVWRAGWPEWRSAAATFPQLAGLLAAPEVAVAPAHGVATNYGATPISNANGMPAPVGSAMPTGQLVQSVAASRPQLPVAAEPLSAQPAQGLPIRRRRHKTDTSIIASSILVVVSIILVIWLVVLFRSQNASPEREPEVRRDMSSGKPVFARN